MARILVVDDDKAQRLALLTMIEGTGHEALEAEEANKALDVCREGDISVVVTDLQMPGMHGLELITLLRELLPRPTIIAISGTGSDQLSVAEGLGADATLAKPIFADRLLGAVDEALADEDALPVFVVSDPPQRDVDLDAASAIMGLDVFQTRLKFIFPAPEFLAATGARRAAQIAGSFKAAGVRLALIDGQQLAEIPWPDPVSMFAFTAAGLTVTLRNRAVTLPYDSGGVAVYCSPPSDFLAKRRPTSAPDPGTNELALASDDGPAIVEAMEKMSNLDLHYERDGELHRISIAAGFTDFSGLGSMQRATAAESMEATLAECKRRFTHMYFDTRLENVRPRRRYVAGESEQDENPAVRKRYSFGTPLLREILGSISPEMSDLTQYELGSRLGYITSRDRPPDWRS